MSDNYKLSKDMYCESCGKKNGYYRFRTGEFVCRACGHITKLLRKKELDGKSE